MSTRSWLWLILFLLVGIGIGWFGSSALNKQSVQVASSPTLSESPSATPTHDDSLITKSTVTVPVRVHGTSRRDVQLSLDAQGTLRPRHDVRVVPKMSGRVDAVLVEVGDVVRAGDRLLQLEDEELRIAEQQAEAAVRGARANVARLKAGARPEEIQLARSQAAQADANYRQASTQYDRARSLFASGAVPESQLEQARTQFEVAKASLDAAESQLSLAEQGASAEEIDAAEASLAQAEAGLALARLQRAHADVTAPIDGTVAAIDVELGGFATAGMAAVRIVQVDPVVLRVEVGGRDIVRLSPGYRARLFINAFPSDPFDGRVSLVETTADESSRLFGVRIETPNPDNTLRSGMTARVQIAVDEAIDVVAVPEDALLLDADGASVYVAVDGYASRRAVSVGLVADGWAEIKDGLDPGEDVIVSGQSFLTDGAPIQVVERATP